MRGIVLVGNPNVGKTTFYNNLTKKSEHTGNWNGKTVDVLKSTFKIGDKVYEITDLPGIYSLIRNSEEENIAIKYLKDINDEKVILLIDGTNLSRGLFLFYQTQKFVDAKNIILLITMKDMLEKANVEINLKYLQDELKTKVFFVNNKKMDAKKIVKEIITKDDIQQKNIGKTDEKTDDYNDEIISLYKKCDEISKKAVNKNYQTPKLDEKIDTLLFNRFTGIPIMLLFFSFILWISVVVTDYGQSFLYNCFGRLLEIIYLIFEYLKVPNIITNIIVTYGMQTAFFVASVMLPAVLIFFFIFSVSEEFGIIPRIVFNLDGLFSKFSSNGKNAISMFMGFGCNCVGVTSTRIFEDEKSRKMAILTNNFIPCSGRLPTIILLISMFLADNTITRVIIVMAFIFFSMCIYVFILKIMSHNNINDENNFIVEIPPYKTVDLKKVFKETIIDKTLFVLGKSVHFAFFSGIFIYFLQNISIGEKSIFIMISDFLNPLGTVMGLSGIILTAFIIGISANEIILPIIIMLYTGSSIFAQSSYSSVSLLDNGFTFITAISIIILSLCHSPCIATLSTIKKETNSTKFMIICAVVPTVIGVILTILSNFILTNLQNFLIF